jgi:hypothetical protein
MMPGRENDSPCGIGLILITNTVALLVVATMRRQADSVLRLASAAAVALPVASQSREQRRRAYCAGA